MRDSPRDDREDVRVERSPSPPADVGDGPGHAAQGSYVASFALSREEVEARATAARALVPQLVRAAGWPPNDATDGPAVDEDEAASQWRRKDKAPAGVALWDRPGLGGDAYAVRSAASVQAPLELVLAALAAAPAAAHRSLTRIVFGGVVADASVLCHHALRGAQGDALAVRWVACRAGGRPLAAACDLCLEQLTMRLSPSSSASSTFNMGNQEWADSESDSDPMPHAVQLMRSVESRWCPELRGAAHARLERAHVPLGGFLLYPQGSGAGGTRVVFFLALARRAGQAERHFRAAKHVARELARRVGRLRNAVDALRLSARLDALRASRWVADAARASCASCARRFHALARRRHHCRLCGEVVCRDCSALKDADLPTVGLTKLRICAACNAQDLEACSYEEAAAVAPMPRRLDWRSATAIEPASAVPPLPIQVRRYSTANDCEPMGVLSCPKPANTKNVAKAQAAATPLPRAASRTSLSLMGSWRRRSVDAGNQPQSEAAAPALEPRGIARLDACLDILAQLCVQAIEVCGARHAALSVFRPAPSAGGALADAARLPTEHFMHSRGGRDSLMRVAPNLRACEPVLQLARAVATRDAALPAQGFEFAQLPVVAGPQRARLYVGVPLLDARRRWLGALAVFDARPMAPEDDTALRRVVDALEALAGEATAAVGEREKQLALDKFLQAPLVQGHPKSQHGSGNQGEDEVEELRREAPAPLSVAWPAKRAALQAGRSPLGSPMGGGGVTRADMLRSKMGELVRQARETQAQTRENAAAMQRGGLRL